MTVPIQRNRREENEAIGRGEVPDDWSSAKRAQKDVDARCNRRIARQRAFGEHPFARLAHMGGKCLRTIGLARAKAVIELKGIAHNLMRLARLQQRGIVPV